MKIGVICDDFTGTASAGAFVANTGAKTGLFFDVDVLKQLEDVDRLDAAYISSNSRHLPAAEAYAAVKTLAEELVKMGVSYFAKKIDTTLRGGIGHEVDAMLDTLGEDYVAVMVTAMPPSRRICVGGYSIIDGTILTETPVRHDVKTPVLDSYVPNIMSGQSKYPVALITMNDVLEGAEHLAAKLQEVRAAGNRIIIVDSITMEHIDVVAQACVALSWKVLPIDPGPFTKQLAFRQGLIEDTKEAVVVEVTPDYSKTALLVCGSANPFTQKQMDYLRAQDEKVATVSVDPLLLLDDKADVEISRAANTIIELIRSVYKPNAILVETALHGSVLNLAEEDAKRGYTSGKSSWLINDGLARITNMVLATVGQEKIAGILLTGGDTMEQVARKIGVICIQEQRNICAQVDVGRIIGKYDNLPLIVKGGFCGYEEVGPDIVKRLFEEAAK